MEPSEPPQQRELLEVPSTSHLERRLLVEQPQRPRRKPNIKAVPQSGLLGRLQAFLPTLQAANADLAQLPPGAAVMERCSDEDEEQGGGGGGSAGASGVGAAPHSSPYVELDLACGLFDLKDEAAVAAAERSLVARGVAVERYGGGSDSEGHDSDSEDGSASSSSDSQGGSGDMGVAPGKQQQQQPGRFAAAAARPGRRRQKGKPASGQRHTGIQELP